MNNNNLPGLLVALALLLYISHAMINSRKPLSHQTNRMHTKPTLAAINPAVAALSPSSVPNNPAIFQAIGLIEGKVSQVDRKFTVAIADSRLSVGYSKQYPLFCHKKRVVDALEEAIASNGVHQKLIVYPKITHFPGQRPCIIAFQLVGFVGDSNSGLATELRACEFKLSGLWQFIPVCRTPCITIQKNFTDERLAYIKEATAADRVRFTRASHVPVVWCDAPMSPFRFNPRLEKETQGKPSFVQVKARFSPLRDVFEFVSMVGESMQEPPPFLKAGKKDKSESAKLRSSQPKQLGSPETERSLPSKVKLQRPQQQ